MFISCVRRVLSEHRRLFDYNGTSLLCFRIGTKVADNISKEFRKYFDDVNNDKLCNLIQKKKSICDDKTKNHAHIE